MVYMKQILKLLFAGILTGSLIFATSCARHPNEEQIQQLEETRSAALSAEQKLEETRQERQQLESQLEQKQQELEKVQQYKEDVQKRLENWEDN